MRVKFYSPDPETILSVETIIFNVLGKTSHAFQNGNSPVTVDITNGIKNDLDKLGNAGWEVELVEGKSDLSNVKVGDILQRIYEKTSWDAKVLEINDDEIICEIIVDQPRIMKFNRKTGISTLGIEYGYIQFS